MYTRTATNILILLLFLCGVEGHAKPQHQPAPNPNALLSPYNSPVYSDFDSDNKIDRAELTSDGPLKKVYVTFGKSSSKLLSFDSGVPERGRLLSGDIDNDGDADLIWVSQSYPQKLVLWLGDGRGNFSLAAETDQDLSGLQMLLGEKDEGLMDHSNGTQLACVLLKSGGPGMPSTVRKLDYPSLNQPVSTFQQTHILAAFRAVFQQRGPPLKFS